LNDADGNVSVVEDSPKSFQIHKVKLDQLLSPPITPDSSVGFWPPPSVVAPQVHRCLFMPTFHNCTPLATGMPRLMPDVLNSNDDIDEDALLPFHPVSNMPSIIKEETHEVVISSNDTSKVPAKELNRNNKVASKNPPAEVFSTETKFTLTKAPEKDLKTIQKIPKPLIKPQEVKRAYTPAEKVHNSIAEMEFSAYLAQVRQFVSLHGHCVIPYRYPLNQKLSRWAKRQRYQYKLFMQIQNGVEVKNKTSSLNPERIAALNDLGFCWSLLDAHWDEMFQTFEDYTKRTGSQSVPKQSGGLGRWCCSQRRQLVSGHMSITRFMKLEKAGFAWWIQKPSKELADQYNKMQRLVSGHYQEEGTETVDGAKGVEDEGAI
jgi:hypothetical protein